MTNHWIFSRFRNDFFAFWALAFLVFILCHPYFSFFSGQWLVVFVTYVLIDTGHAYVTALRTYFNKTAIKLSPKLWLVPIACFTCMFIWAFLGVPYFWAFIIYFTFYHNTKQHYGIMAWYCKINNCRLNWLSFFLYALTVMPFVSFHFREINYKNIYSSSTEIFFYPNSVLFSVSVLLNLFLLSVFLLFFLLNLKRNKINLPVVAAIVFPAIVNFYCFTYGANMEQVLMPLLIIHGVSYFFLTAYVLRDQSKEKNNSVSLISILLTVILIACIFGSGERFLASNFVEYLDSESYRGQFLWSLAASLIVMPSLTHYVLDGIIWRKTDPIFSKVFQ